MTVLASDNELLKLTEIWNKTEALFKKKINSKPVYNNEYIRTNISLYNENFWGNKSLTKNECYGHSILLLESISEVRNYPQTLLDKFFECNSIEKHNGNNVNSLFKELV